MAFVTQEQLAAAVAGGAIYGSNANGEYLKFGNGLMLQWRQGNRTDWAINNAYGSLYQGSVTFTFPIAFSSVPTVIPGRAQWGTSASWGTLETTPNTTTFNFRAIDIANRAAGTAVYFTWFAIGRWK